MAIYLKLSEFWKRKANLDISSLDWSWLEKIELDKSKSGAPKSNITNFIRILMNDPFLKDKISIPPNLKICKLNLRNLAIDLPHLEKNFNCGRSYLRLYLEIYGFSSRRGLNDALLIVLSPDSNLEYLEEITLS